MKRFKCAFSLIELLIGMAVIGVIASIALPSLVRVVNEGADAKTTRNAQMIAHTYMEARAAGAVFVSETSDVRGKVLELVEGKNGSGIMSTCRFRINALAAAELRDVLRRLAYDAATDSMVITSGT
jgi:prepilin-type N-terminal cleavage/methylation domain-containing protein